MGFRLSKSIRLGRFIRLNISKSGIGGSIGLGGLRLGVGPQGTRLTADLPGAGTSYVKQWGGGARKRRGAALPETAPLAASGPQEIPAPGTFAPGHEKEFVRGLNAHRSGDADAALENFLAAAEEEPAAAISAAFILAGRGGEERRQAAALLEGVVQRDEEFPTPLMQKYLAGAQMPIRITPGVEATVPVGELAAALLLVELYQEQGRAGEATGLLEELEELAGSPVLKLSLCELYAAQGLWDGVVEQARGVEAVDDVTLEIATYYGRAMQSKGLHEAALSVFAAALKKKKGRSPALLRETRYWRAVSYQESGKRALANKEFQKLYAEDPSFRDVAHRVGLTP